MLAKSYHIEEEAISWNGQLFVEMNSMKLIWNVKKRKKRHLSPLRKKIRKRKVENSNVCDSSNKPKSPDNRAFRLRGSAASIIIAAEKEKQKNPAAVVTAKSKSTSVSSIITTESHKDQNPDDTAAASVTSEDAITKSKSAVTITIASTVTITSTVSCCNITHVNSSKILLTLHHMEKTCQVLQRSDVMLWKSKKKPGTDSVFQIPIPGLDIQDKRNGQPPVLNSF